MAGYHPDYYINELARGKPEREARLASRRAKSSTRVECPLCQREQPRYGKYYRPKDEACDECLGIFWRAEDTAAAEKARLDNAELDILAISRNWPYVSRPRGDRATEAPVDTIMAEIKGLVKAMTLDRVERELNTGIGTPTIRGREIRPSKHSFHNTGRGALMINVPAGAGDVIEALPDTITEALSVIYEAGVQCGSSLIARLASGEITLDQFDSRGKQQR
jgi:hypothetical protein